MYSAFKTGTGTAGAVGISQLAKAISPSSSLEKGLIIDGLESIV